MHIPTLGETELLVPLHEGVLEQPRWLTFLSRFRRQVNAESCELILSPQDGRDSIAFTSGVFTYPNVRSTSILREDRVYSDADHECDDQHDLRIVRWSDSVLSDCRLIVTGEKLAPVTSGLMIALLPHMKASVRLFTALELERTRTRVEEEAFRQMNFGWISLNSKCQIIDHDQGAGRSLDRTGLLSRGAYNRLIPASPNADRILTQVVKDYVADRHARPRTINLSRDPWVDILVSPYREQSLVGGNEAVAVVYLRGDGVSSADRHHQLVDMFQLTPSEARMAWTMAHGLSIAEAAAENGLTVETARNYSKKIYAKVGARGQADLVRHVLTGVLAMG